MKRALSCSWWRVAKSWRYWARILRPWFTVRVLRSQTTKTVRYGRGGNAFCRSCYVAV
jgi:hypothetical protein